MFIHAKPVWIAGKELEMNVYAVFRTEIRNSEDLELHIAGTVFYRVHVNGRFAGFGPARTAWRYVREDIFRLDRYMIAGEEKSEITVEAMGYGCHSLSTVWQPSCLLAEVQSQGNVLAYTGKDFEGYLPDCRIQKAERYSGHRHFCEIWDYRTCKPLTDAEYQAAVTISPDMPDVLDRRVPYPKYDDISLKQICCCGTYAFDESLSYVESRYPEGYPEWWGRFDRKEIPCHPYKWLQRQRQTITARDKSLPLLLKKGEYVVCDFRQIEVGFLKLHMESAAESDIVIGFSEYYQGEAFRLPNMDANNVMECLLAKGDSREFLSFEPYAFRYVMIAVKEGCITLGGAGVLTYMFDDSGIVCPECENQVLQSVLHAAVRTFAHNAVDLYTDCPSRERAGWLCDSYFTARAEYAMTGKTVIEDAFLENYRLYKNRGDLPEGMLPEAYPSDIRPGGEFIPQWALWYILEVEEYVHVRGYEDMAESFRQSIYGLLRFFKQYENDEGLLERLPSRNFVEWSRANEWTRDVNYPTNFLYAKALKSVYRLYGDEEWRMHSEQVRRAAVEQSFNGYYFVDHALRNKDGMLEVQTDASEACQYYAVLFAGIDIEEAKYNSLKTLILDVFAPDRNGVMPEIEEVNAFIGAYLRMEVLLKMNEYKLLLRDIEGFFGKMAEYTGTLWENCQFEGSYDHGFASYSFVAVCEAQKGKCTERNDRK